MKNLLLLFAILPAITLPLHGATEIAVAEPVIRDEARIAPDGERFLFVVETSSDTRKMEPGCRQTVFDLVFHGVNGQMRKGDTFGIWTFNQDVQAGKFPMTVWEPDHNLELAGRAAGFLKNQKYSRNPDIESLILNLRTVAQQAGDVNVFLVSSGQEPIAGTPYDDGINSAYKTLSKQRARAGKPLITTFVVRRSRVIAASVAIPGDRITLPARQAPRRPGAATPNSPSNAVARLAPLTSTNPPPIPAKKVIQIVTKSNPPPAITTLVAAPVVSTNTAPAQSFPALATANDSEDEPPVTSAPPEPVEPSIASTAPAPPPALISTPSSDVPTQTPTQTQTSAPAAASAALAAGSVAEETATPSIPGRVLATVAEALNPPPLTVAARETPAPAQANELTDRATQPSSSVPNRAPLGLQAMTVSRPSLSPAVLLSIGGLLLGLATFLLVLILRRTQPATRSSLITQSMDRG